MTNDTNQPKHTPGPWYAIEFAGFWNILDQPYYEGAQLLNAEEVGPEQAQANAELAALAPDLLAENQRLKELMAEMAALLKRHLLLPTKEDSAAKSMDIGYLQAIPAIRKELTNESLAAIEKAEKEGGEGDDN